MQEVDKTFFIEGTELTKVDESTIIPTALCYADNKNIYLGHKAYGENKGVNYNFKIDLGEYTVGSENESSFECADGKMRNAFQLSEDFFKLVLSKIEGQNAVPGYEKKGLKIIVAEPLSFYSDKDKHESWIKNYRENIKRILHHYESVEFLPEPFAVYQYYRYGLRIPQLQQNLKNVALILDFGGGTFDVSIIESTNNGDISLRGKHSKPLAAASDPIGGFFINEKIGEYLIVRNLEGSDKKKSIAYIDIFQRVKKGKLNLVDINTEKQVFISNLKKLIAGIELKKIELSNHIKNWDLEFESYDKVYIAVPRNPFSLTSPWDSLAFHGHEFRNMFTSDIWEKFIKKTIRSAFEHAGEQLNGKPITVTLISGGSSNIRWLEKLIVRDFYEQIQYAKPIPLSGSFQEVVAKGLAIECARRNYEPESEFVSVTYNPVRLLLNPDDKGLEIKSYQSVGNKIDMHHTREGDLLPSAQTFMNFIEEPLQWKVRLNHPPKHSLKYYFMRPSLHPLEDQPNDIENIYNIDNVVYTEQDTQFDSKIKVELLVKADGTAIPRFIYKSGNHGEILEQGVTGKPFVLDMTGESTNIDASRFIGFDFGTSNSSVCYLTSDRIHILEECNSDMSWLELMDLIPKLPYPIAFPLRKYLRSYTTLSNSIEDARDAFEAMLAFTTFVAASELLSQGSLGSLMKGFAHRSMRPLKDLLGKCLGGARGKEFYFTDSLNKTFMKYGEKIDEAINQFNDHKHNKLAAEKVNAHNHVKLMANICNISFSNKLFGYIEDVKPQPFKKTEYVGVFRVAHDNQPFVVSYKYTGAYSFSPNEPLIVDLKTGKCLSMLPFYFIEESATNHAIKCYVFDKRLKDKISFKFTDENMSIAPENAEIIEPLINMLEGKPVQQDIYTIKIEKAS